MGTHTSDDKGLLPPAGHGSFSCAAFVSLLIKIIINRPAAE